MRKILQMAVLGLLLTACSENDDNDVDPEQPAKTCLLTKLTAQGGEMNFTFNADGYVIKKEVSSSTGKDTYDYTYDISNQLKTIVQYQGSNQTSKKEFTYTNSLISIIKTTTGSNIYTDTLIYNGTQRLVETRQMEYPNSFNSFYKYDNNGNLIEVESFSYNQLAYRSTFGNYDNKLNPYVTLKGHYFQNDEMDLIDSGQFMKNNPGFVKHVSISHQSNGTIQENIDVSNTYTYIYNENNLPATITTKYKDGSEVKLDATYNCQ
jgi:hypothetical protein